MDYDTQVKKKCKERMKQKVNNKTYHSPINFSQTKSPPCFSLLFLAYADFILHHHLPDKQEVESFKELKDCRRRTNFIPVKQIRSNGEEDAPKALFLEYDNTPALMWQPDQQHHASYHHQWSPSHTLEITQHVESTARQGTTWGVNVSLDPNKVPTAAEVSLLANGIK